MSKKEKSLPTPPNRTFGRSKKFGQPEDQGSLLADRLAAAMAEGKLDEFLKQEMPDNEYARNLATMMMGMTGMAPGMLAAPSGTGEPDEEAAAEKKSESSSEVPEDVARAIQGGDVQSLMALLRREHRNRMPGAEAGIRPEEHTAASSPPADQPMIDKELIDALVRIAKDNSVTMDWIILRAIKVYVEEYRKTGKL